MATVPAMFTYEDLQKMPDDGRRYELIGGVIVVSPSPNQAHQELAGRLSAEIRTFVRANNLGRAYFAPFDVRISPHDVVQPDLLFVSRDRLGIMHDNYVDGAPDLVVEILSPSTRTRDEGEKLALYAAAGVREYWLVDPQRRTFRALALDADRYQLITAEGSVVGSRVLEGLKIDVSALFADLP